MDELLREFLTETAESLDHVDAQLVRFEREPNNGQVLSNIFRLVHTIKGTCGFLGLPRDQLMTMVSELVLTRNQLLEVLRRRDDCEFNVPLQRLSSVTTQVQREVMKTRMQPIGHAWQQAEINNLIFAPGFSTALEITSISGRGVGMDIVRNNIEKFGGTVDVKSAPGSGTTFVIKIPLTLAIVAALIVEIAGERFAF